MRYLLDTTAASQIGRPQAPAPVQRWLDRWRDDDRALSVLTLGEMRLGIERLRPRDPDAAEALDTRLGGVVRALSGRVLPVKAEIAERWGALQAERGPVPAADCLIAATALCHGLAVVTRNVADLARCGVGTVNPWGDA